MPPRLREGPWLKQHENGVDYVHWYVPSNGRTKRLSLRIQDNEEANHRYGEFLISGTAKTLPAEESGLSLPTIKRVEKDPGAIPGTRSTEAAIEAAFARAQVEFLHDRGEGVIRLRDRR